MPRGSTSAPDRKRPGVPGHYRLITAGEQFGISNRPAGITGGILIAIP